MKSQGMTKNFRKIQWQNMLRMHLLGLAPVALGSCLRHSTLPLFLRILTGSFPHDNFSSVYWIFTKLGHMIPLWKGKNPIYFEVITIIPFDNLYRRAYFVMHTFLVLFVYLNSLTLCTLQFWSNLTKISFQGKHFNYFCASL
jgi:hypothetical protein